MITAAWIPSWYELDQPLKVGRRTRLAFFKAVPENLSGSEELVFQHHPWDAANTYLGIATVSRIFHRDLGELHEIDTHGLEYTLVLASGARIFIEAEEDPGSIRAGPGCATALPQHLSTLRFHVELADWSELDSSEDPSEGGSELGLG